MNNLRFFVIVGMLAFVINVQCAENANLQSKFHIGTSGGYSLNNSFSGDIYGGLPLSLNSKNLEQNFGISYFKNSTDFDNVKGLFYNSFGIFTEVNYFLITNFYIGARYSINMNFVDPESQNTYTKLSPKDPPTYFTGMAVFCQFGYSQSIGEKFIIRLQSQTGIQNFRMATGALYFSNSDSPIPSNLRDKYAEEHQSKLLSNLSVNLIVKL